jgi:hypothetical protein
METEIYLERREKIEKGLQELADDLYAALEEASKGPEWEELVSRAKEKIKLFDELWAELDEEERAELQPINSYIKDIRAYIQK